MIQNLCGLEVNRQLFTNIKSSKTLKASQRTFNLNKILKEKQLKVNAITYSFIDDLFFPDHPIN